MYKLSWQNYEYFLSVYPEHFEARENLANSYLLENNVNKAINEFAVLYKKKYGRTPRDK